MMEITNDEENSIFQAGLLDHSSGNAINEINESWHPGSERQDEESSELNKTFFFRCID